VEEGSFVDAKILKTEGKPDLRRMLIPIGPVAVFGVTHLFSLPLKLRLVIFLSLFLLLVVTQLGNL
jgi:hypothetical protein